MFLNLICRQASVNFTSFGQNICSVSFMNMDPKKIGVGFRKLQLYTLNYVTYHSADYGLGMHIYYLKSPILAKFYTYLYNWCTLGSLIIVRGTFINFRYFSHQYTLISDRINVYWLWVVSKEMDVTLKKNHLIFIKMLVLSSKIAVSN